MPLTDKTITFIGAGNMGEALIRGLLARKVIDPARIIATDVHAERRQGISESCGVRTTDDNAAAVASADLVVLAVKPQQMSQALATFRGRVSHHKMILSIAAGVPTSRIERELGGEPRVVRAMPNTPAQIGAGAAAICRGRYATEGDLTAAEAILRSVGVVVRTEEGLMDGVTALSGTGPAYLYLLAEAMIDGGTEVGLSPEMSRKLTVQTLLGAARLLAESHEEPGLLRRKVTSPGGTTEAAMGLLAQEQWVETFVEAVRAAARRSKELSAS